MLEKIFKLKENNTTARTEIIAGLTTFMTMAYIIALNPNLLTGFGKDHHAGAVERCFPGNLHCIRHRYHRNGISGKQAFCHGTRHGTEQLFCSS